MIHALALALLGQCPSPVPVPDKVRDLSFVLIQEAWVAERPRFPRVERFLSRDDCDLLKRLGCSLHACREDVSGHIRAKGFGAARLLFWGCRSDDREVAARSRALLDELWRCQTCRGSGSCGKCSRDWWCEGSCTATVESKCVCPVCMGSGDFRYTLAGFRWVDGNRYPELAPRSAFCSSGTPGKCGCHADSRPESN